MLQYPYLVSIHRKTFCVYFFRVCVDYTISHPLHFTIFFRQKENKRKQEMVQIPDASRTFQGEGASKHTYGSAF